MSAVVVFTMESSVETESTSFRRLSVCPLPLPLREHLSCPASARRGRCSRALSGTLTATNVPTSGTIMETDS